MRMPLMALFCSLAACAHAGRSPTDATPPSGAGPLVSNPRAAAAEAVGRAYMEMMIRHDYQGEIAVMTPAMKKAVPLERLEKNYDEGRWGRALAVEGVRAQQRPGGWWAVLVNVRYQSDVHTESLFLDDQMKVGGAWDIPTMAAPRMFLDALGSHDWRAAYDMSDPTMHAAAPPEKLAEAWGQLEAQFGLFERNGQILDRGLFALVEVVFGHTRATFNVAVDKYGEITGFHVVSVGEPLVPQDPPASPTPQLDFGRQSG